jgi:hypothetical protein
MTCGARSRHGQAGPLEAQPALRDAAHRRARLAGLPQPEAGSAGGLDRSRAALSRLQQWHSRDVATHVGGAVEREPRDGWPLVDGDGNRRPDRVHPAGRLQHQEPRRAGAAMARGLAAVRRDWAAAEPPIPGAAGELFTGRKIQPERAGKSSPSAERSDATGRKIQPDAEGRNKVSRAGKSSHIVNCTSGGAGQRTHRPRRSTLAAVARAFAATPRSYVTGREVAAAGNPKLSLGGISTLKLTRHRSE